MNFSGTKCDECGRVKGESNHWHQIGMIPSTIGGPWIELGSLAGPHSLKAYGDAYEIHDLCGESCFYKHIGKILRITTTSGPERERAERER